MLDYQSSRWNAEGKPVRETDSPGMVPCLPILGLLPNEKVPSGISVRLLAGNWYGDGPEVVLWHSQAEVHCTFPLAKRSPAMFKKFSGYVVKAAKQKNGGRKPVNGGYYV